MMGKENSIRKWAFATLLILTAIFVFSLYGKVFWSPNSYLFTASGDGIKNYYSWVWHLKNDSTVLDFQGMNYPYGQHFMYTDCHPLLYFAVKPISLVFPGILNYSIGILNIFLLLSFFLTPIFLWLIFRQLKVQPFLAVLGALGISMLAPQVFRLTGHLSLSYSYFIPLTLWLILKAWDRSNRKMKWDILLFFNGMFWFFIHPYLGMMATAFLFVFWTFYFLLNFKSELRNVRTYLRLVLTTLLPVLLFLAFVKLTDDRSGRSDNPSGFFLYNAEPDDVFIPLYPPLRPLIDQFVEVRQQWEAWSYIGLLSLGVLIFVIVRSFQNLFRSRKFIFDKKYIADNNFKLILWSSLVLLIFSFGWPFKLFPETIDWLPLVKQFRATGRFTWFFFFSVNILAVVILSNLWKQQVLRSKVVHIGLLVIMTLPMIEGLPYHLDYSRQLTKQVNLFRLSNNDTSIQKVISQINPSDYQAIIPLPFYYNGSENFSIPVRGNAMAMSAMVSYHTQLPILGGALSRTGIEESRRSIQILSPDYYSKKIKDDIPSEKPFLIVRATGEITPYEQALLNKSALLLSTDKLSFYKLDKKTLFISSADAELRNYILLNDTNPTRVQNPRRVNRKLHNRNGFLVSDTTSFIYFNEFSNNKALNSFAGLGAFTGNKKDHLMIAEFGPGTFEANTTYTISAWFYNGGQDALNFWFRFRKEEYDPRTDNWSVSHVLPENSQVIFGDWSLVELDFQVADSRNEVSFKTIGKSIDKQVFYLDDLLIRKKDVVVYKVLHEQNGEIFSLFKNNQRIIRE